MLKRLATLVGFFFATCCAPSPKAPGVDLSYAAQRALDSTVVILRVEGSEVLGLKCAGTFVKPDVIATAQHCVEGSQQVYYTTREEYSEDDTEVFEGKVAYENEDRDVALVVVETAAQDFVPLGFTPGIAEIVHSIGHPRSVPYTRATGIVSLPNVNGRIEVMISIGPGSSGGGLYDAEWRLIGICSQMSRGASRGFFANVNAIKNIL